MDIGTRTLDQLLSRFPRISDADRRVLEKWLAHFEAKWSPRYLARIAGDLPGPDSAIRLPALYGTLLVDLRRRWECDKPIAVEQYVQMFPEIAAEGRELASLLKEEFDIRKGLGQTVSIDQYVGRFPKLAAAIRRWTKSGKETDGDIRLDQDDDTVQRISSKPADAAKQQAPRPTPPKEPATAGNAPAPTWSPPREPVVQPMAPAAPPTPAVPPRPEPPPPAPAAQPLWVPLPRHRRRQFRHGRYRQPRLRPRCTRPTQLPLQRPPTVPAVPPRPAQHRRACRDSVTDAASRGCARLPLRLRCWLFHHDRRRLLRLCRRSPRLT